MFTRHAFFNIFRTYFRGGVKWGGGVNTGRILILILILIDGKMLSELSVKGASQSGKCFYFIVIFCSVQRNN